MEQQSCTVCGQNTAIAVHKLTGNKFCSECLGHYFFINDGLDNADKVTE